MKWIKKIGTFFSTFRSKYKVSVRDPHNDKEVWYIYLSSLNIFTVLLALLLVLFIASVSILAFTPIMDYLPGKPGYRSRTMLIQSNMKLDSLEHQLSLWTNYYDNLNRIMDGQTPVSLDQLMARDTVQAAPADIPRIPEDSILRAQMENPGAYQLQTAAAGRSGPTYTDLFPPTAGVIQRKFDPRVGQLGVDIATADNQPVMSIMEGTVISATWSLPQGYIIYVLHPGNIISAYLNNARLTKKAGDRVYSGEVIGFTGGSSSQNDNGFLQFQLWINGTPVDPENYMVF